MLFSRNSARQQNCSPWQRVHNYADNSIAWPGYVIDDLACIFSVAVPGFWEKRVQGGTMCEVAISKLTILHVNAIGNKTVDGGKTYTCSWEKNGVVTARSECSPTRPRHHSKTLEDIWRIRQCVSKHRIQTGGMIRLWRVGAQTKRLRHIWLYYMYAENIHVTVILSRHLCVLKWRKIKIGTGRIDTVRPVMATKHKIICGIMT